MREFIDGAHDMDKHFVETNPRHNLPVLLALVDIWNDTFLGMPARVITPSTEAFAGFPAFVGALEAQTCGRNRSSDGSLPGSGGKLRCSSIVIDGALDDALDRSLYQGANVMSSEMLMIMDSQVDFNASRTVGASGMDDVHASEDSLLCSVFAKVDELAFGHDQSMSGVGMSPCPTSLQQQQELYQSSSASVASSILPNRSTVDITEGNRPSILIMLGKLDAFACGQLIALSEHRAIVKAHIWGLDPFAKEAGSSLHTYRTDQLKDNLQNLMSRTGDEEDEDDEDGEDGDDIRQDHMNLSTKTLLRHYANLHRDQRVYTVKGST